MKQDVQRKKNPPQLPPRKKKAPPPLPPREKKKRETVRFYEAIVSPRYKDQLEQQQEFIFKEEEPNEEIQHEENLEAEDDEELSSEEEELDEEEPEIIKIEKQVESLIQLEIPIQKMKPPVPSKENKPQLSTSFNSVEEKEKQLSPCPKIEITEGLKNKRRAMSFLPNEQLKSVTPQLKLPIQPLEFDLQKPRSKSNLELPIENQPISTSKEKKTEKPREFKKLSKPWSKKKSGGKNLSKSFLKNSNFYRNSFSLRIWSIIPKRNGIETSKRDGRTCK